MNLSVAISHDGPPLDLDVALPAGEIVAVVGQIPLAERRRSFLRGSGVGGYAENPYLGGWVDLAAVSVAH